MDITGVIDGYPDAMDRAEARGWNAAATLANERIAALEAVVEAAREVNRYAHQPPMGLGPMGHDAAKVVLALRDALAVLDGEQ